MSANRIIPSRSPDFPDCVAEPRPPDASTVALVAVSSASLEIQTLRLRTSVGRMNLEGVVTFQPKSWSAGGRKHVDVVFLDATEQRLAVETVPVARRNLPDASRAMRPRGDFSLAISTMPMGTAKIEVRAHESGHGSPKRTAIGYSL